MRWLLDIMCNIRMLVLFMNYSLAILALTRTGIDLITPPFSFYLTVLSTCWISHLWIQMLSHLQLLQFTMNAVHTDCWKWSSAHNTALLTANSVAESYNSSISWKYGCFLTGIPHSEILIHPLSATTNISNNPSFRLKHPGVPDGSDGSDGTSYPLTENYTLPVAQATGRVA